MRGFYQRLSVWLGFVIFSVLLIANALVLRSALKSQITNSRWMEHTSHVLLELEQVQAVLSDAETGQRGYLYTGDRNYLEPFTASRELDSHLNALESLVADNPDQAQPLRELSRLAHEKMQELSNTVELYQSGKTSEARATVLSGRGKQIMDRVRAIVADMRNREAGLYTAREKQAEASQRRTLISIYVLTLISLAGLLVLCAWILRDVRHREKYAAEIQEREQTLQLAASAGDLGLWSWKVGSQEVAATDRCKALFGLRPSDKFDYATGLAIMHPEDREKTETALREAIRDGTPYHAEYRVVWQDGSVHWISAAGRCFYDANGNPARLSGACLDMTERRAAEQAVRTSHSLSAVSQVAHELAHHINNPLAIVAQSLYLLSDPNTRPALRESLLNSAEDATERIARITRQLLGLYSPYATPSQVRITDMLDDAIDAYASGFPPGSVEIIKDYQSGGELFASSTDLRQLCSNLIANAFEHAQLGGRIAVRVSQRRHPVSRQSGVYLLVVDNGSGIPEQYREKLFEAFFSTKEVKGRGLGLWTARSIANKHGGSIRWKTSTRIGRSGTAFRVFIPSRSRTESRLARVSA